MKTLKRQYFLFIVSVFVGAVFLFSTTAWAASTYSFTNTPGRGSHPETLTLKGGVISVDLSSIPRETKIYRAVLVPHRKGNTFHSSWDGAEKKEVLIEAADRAGDFLSLRGPDYLTFNATSVVQRAVKSGQGSMTLNVVSFPFLGSSKNAEYLDSKTGRPVIRLDVTTDLPPRSKIPPVSHIQVMHRSGSTMVSWTDPLPLTSSNDLPSTEFSELQKKDENPHEIRYRIYRHDQPISSVSIGQAQLVGETDSLSVWDWLYYGHRHDFTKKSKGQNIPRYPIDDGVLADFYMGIYVHSINQAMDHVYYAVSRSIDGEEDLSNLAVGENVTQNSLAEAPGNGLVLLRHQEQQENWHYVPGVSTLQYYVKWEAPPRISQPEPFDYLVVIPEKAQQVSQPPLSVALHAWAGSLNRGWLWSYNLDQYGALHVSTNQYPYDWWTGYHENLWTLKPLTIDDGSVKLFSQRRIRSFLDHFVIPKWNVDTERILLHGNSMGGAGASLWGIKTGDYFASLNSMVGVHIPAETPKFVSSFDNVYGPVELGLTYADSGMSVWDYEDNVRWLKDNLTSETPHISFSNGKNDAAIGWSQAWKFAQALIVTKRPFTFKWGMGGHGERPYHMGDTIDFQLHQSLPAFSAGTLDDDLGSTPEVGVDKGQINYYYLWETDSIEDTVVSWGITIFLRDKAPADSAEVNLTPRRLQQFAPLSGKTYKWRNFQEGKLLQEGAATADRFGLVTLRSVIISKKRNRIVMTPAADAIDSIATSALQTLADAGNRNPMSNNVAAMPRPTNQEINISDVSELNAALKNLRSYTTLLLEDGVYNLTRTLVVGKAWSSESQPLKNVVIKGKSDDASKVVLKGPGIATNQEPKTLIHVGYSRGFRLESLTVQDAYFHLLQIHGEHDADGVHLKNVHFFDAGHQLVKVSRDKNLPRFADRGLVEDSLFAFTVHARYSPDVGRGTYYTNGIDVLGGSDWVIRNSIFKNIRAPHADGNPPGLAGSAVLMWHKTKNAKVVENRFIECDIGITFGLTAGDTPDHEGGLIADNFICRKGEGDVGISLNKSRHVIVSGNKVFLNNTFPWTIEERRYKEGANAGPTKIIGNLTDGPIKLRNSGLAIINGNKIIKSPNKCE